MTSEHGRAHRRGLLLFGDEAIDIGASADDHVVMREGWGHQGRFAIVGASVIGRWHSHDRTPRDDSMAVRSLDPWLAVTVSDGAGSRALSHYGSACAVDILSGALLKWMSLLHCRDESTWLESVASGVQHKPSLSAVSPELPNGSQNSGFERARIAMKRAFRETHRGLSRFARRHGVDIEELHCTLLGIVLDARSGSWVAGQVGDGLILALGEDSGVRALIEPAQSDDPSSTHFITEDDWRSHFLCRAGAGDSNAQVRTFFLMTDGVSNDCLYGPPPDILERWARAMDEQLRRVSSPEPNAHRLSRYLQNYSAQGSFDDRTLIVIYQTDETGQVDAGS